MFGFGSSSNNVAPVTFNPAPQVTQLPDMIRQQIGQQAALQGQQADVAQKQNMYASLVLGAAGSTGNPQLYNTALSHLGNMGYDTSMFSKDPTIGAQQAQLMRMYGASPTEALRAMVMNQEMNQRAKAEGIQGADSGKGGSLLPGILFNNGSNAAPQAVQQPAPQQQTQQSPGGLNAGEYAPPAAYGVVVPENMTVGGLPVSVKNVNTLAQMVDQENKTPSSSAQFQYIPPASGNMAQMAQAAGLPPPPQMSQYSSGPQYQRAMQGWKDQISGNPTMQGMIKRQEAEQAQTPELVEQLNKDALGSTNMINAIKEIQTAAHQARTGAFADAQNTMYRVADIFGLPHSDVSKVAAYGDISKISNQLVGTAASQAGQASRLQGEFKAILASTPGLAVDPNAMNSLLPLLTRTKYQVMREQDAWNGVSQKYPNATFLPFQTQWTAHEQKMQQANQGDLPSYPLPTNQPAMGSEAYKQQQAQPIQYKSGLIRNGYVFKGGDPTQQSNWMKVK